LPVGPTVDFRSCPDTTRAFGLRISLASELRRLVILTSFLTLSDVMAEDEPYGDLCSGRAWILERQRHNRVEDCPGNSRGAGATTYLEGLRYM
jgi:hypothetical protein